MSFVSLILLAGGIGSRMKSAEPKQFLKLGDKPLVFYSLEVFLKLEEINEIVVVAPQEYHHLFSSYKCAKPGARRQDSVYNGLQMVSEKADFILTHDGVRPFITVDMVKKLIVEGKKVGAATLGMPVKPTIKECNGDQFVERTPDRAKVWEIQTPQFLTKKLIDKGFSEAIAKNLTVTDDTSLAELINHPVKLVEGSYTNLKITTPEDLPLAETILNRFL